MAWRIAQAPKIAKAAKIADTFNWHQHLKYFKLNSRAPRAGDLCKVRVGSKTVLAAPKRHFRSTPNNGRHHVGRVGPFRARSGHSIVSSAPACASSFWQPCFAKTLRQQLRI